MSCHCQSVAPRSHSTHSQLRHEKAPPAPCGIAATRLAECSRTRFSGLGVAAVFSSHALRFPEFRRALHDAAFAVGSWAVRARIRFFFSQASGFVQCHVLG